MRIFLITIYLFISIVLTSFAIQEELVKSPCDATCQRQELEILLQFYNSTGGENWEYHGDQGHPERNRKWGTYGDCTLKDKQGVVQKLPIQCCWSGVCCCLKDEDTCNLYFLYQQLPLQIKQIEQLRDNLDDNTIQQLDQNTTTLEEQTSIQFAEQCRINSTRALFLSSMNLSGSIPDQDWGKLTGLDIFITQRNKLNGSIPESFGSLTHMRLLAMDRNYFRGSLPASITQMKLLQVLSLQSNEFTGTIPDGMLHMSDLNLVYLGFNQLNGTIPPLVGQDVKLNNITSLEMQNNQLSGTFPIEAYLQPLWAAVNGAYQLTYLNLRGNKLVGTLPHVLGTALPKMVEFDVGENNFEGTLPETVGSMYSLRRLSLDYNSFNGTIPTFGESPVLRDLFLGHNKFFGTIPPQLFQLGIEQLDLSHNKLEGTIPGYTGSNLLFRLLNLGNNEKLGAFKQTPNGTEQIQSNGCGEPLPRFLKFQLSQILVTQSALYDQQDSENGSVVGQIGEIMCPMVLLKKNQFEEQEQECRVWNGKTTDYMRREDYIRLVSLSPRYYNYVGCRCPEGLDMTWIENSEVPGGRDLICTRSSEEGGFRTLVYIILIVAIFCFGFACASWRFRARLSENILLMRKRNGPPSAGNTATVVVTDIEGSTALTDHHGYAMQAALNAHDSLVRRIRWQHAGYESNTEGDSFTIVFHEAMDALAFCLQVQQALLHIDWSPEIMDNEFAAEKLKDSIRNVHSQGTIRNLSGDSLRNSNRSGEQLRGAGRSNELPRARRRSIGSSIASFAGQSILRFSNRNLPKPPSQLEVIKESNSNISKDDQLEDAIEMVEGFSQSSRSWYEESVQEEISGGSNRSNGAETNTLFKGLRVRMAVATGTISTRSMNRLTGRVEIQGPVMDKVNAIADIPQGGQIIMDLQTFQEVNGRLDELGTVDKDGYNQKKLPSATVIRQRRRKNSASRSQVVWSIRSLSTTNSTQSIRNFMKLTKKPRRRIQSKYQSVMNFCRKKVLGLVSEEDEQDQEISNENIQAKVVSLGGFRLAKLDDGQSIIKMLEIYSPNLLQRSQYFRDAFLLTEGRVFPSFYEAPGVSQIKLGAFNPLALMPQVVIGFCAIEHIKSLSFLANEKELGDQFYSAILKLIDYCLDRTRGYLCQDSLDTFMLAFSSPVEGVQFSLLLQEVMFRTQWPKRIMQASGFRQEYDNFGNCVFNGPRVKFGLYEGMPTQITPHTTTGRADYFGPLVNRAARFCHAGAHGGQVVLTRQMMQSVLASWNITNISLEKLCQTKSQMMAHTVDSLKQITHTEAVLDKFEDGTEIKQIVVEPFDENHFGSSNSSRSTEVIISKDDSFRYREKSGNLEDEREVVEIYDIGSYEFKGCDGKFQMVYIVSERLSQYSFPYGLAKTKGKCVAQGVGFLCKVQAPANFTLAQ